MGSQKGYRDLILESIDQLRKRKARPDLERICHLLERRHGLKTADIHENLAKLVDEGVVIKVDYKGNTSYRNAAKWSRNKSHYYGSFFSASDISTAVLEAVEKLSYVEGASVRGAPLTEIEKYLQKKDSQVCLNQSSLRTVLEKEVLAGNLRQLINGDFVLVIDQGATWNKKVQSAKKLCKASPPKPVEETCEYCMLGAASNLKGIPEKLLVCRDCNSKAHPSCADTSSDTTIWKCPDCKLCVICSGTNNTDQMVFCITCGKGYHTKCHSPPIRPRSMDNWACFHCSRKLDNSKYSSTSDSGESAQSDSQNSCRNIVDAVFKRCLDDYPNIVPVADNWGTREVEMFVECLGYEHEASAFREQEIDGASLLLLKRSDVLTGLDIKLGPALKIYEHILRLQHVEPEPEEEEEDDDDDEDDEDD